MTPTQTSCIVISLEIPLNYHRCVSTLVPPTWVQWPPWAHSQPSPRIQGEKPNQPPARSGKNRDQKSPSREANETTTDLMKSHVFFVATHTFLKNIRVFKKYAGGGHWVSNSWRLHFSRWWSFPQIGMNIENIWNHHLVMWAIKPTNWHLC